MKLNYPSVGWIKAGAIALAFTLTTAMFGQGVTTSGLSGFVTDKDGKPVAGASVEVVLAASGTRYTAITRSTGQYTVSGIIPGGPYTVTAAAAGYPEATRTDIYLQLGSVSAVDLALSSEIVKMEAYQVSESGTNTTFDSSSMGTGSNYNEKEIGAISSVRRDIQDIQNLDPRAVVMQVSPSDPAYTFSVAGQNPRENALLVDGVSAADNFGLNSNGYAGLRNPVPFDWISNLSLQINPYDVIYSGFLGAVTDITLKSGTNEFHGSAYEIYTGTSFRGPDPVIGLLGAHEPLQEHTTGFTLGGPIIPNKLFFFVGYEAFREIAAPPVQLFNPLTAPAGATEYNEIVSTLKSRYNYDPGSLNAISHTWEQNFVGKVDWNISDSQKFSFTFRHTIGDAPVFYNYSGSFETSFNTAWYNSNRSDQSYTAQLNSDWSKIISNFHTEIEATYKRYNGTATLNGPKEPAITIEGVTGVSEPAAVNPITSGEIFAGTYYAYQDNNIYTWEQEEHAYGDYSIGNHTFKFGAQFDRTGYTDTFIPNQIGSITYDTVAHFLANTPDVETVEIPAAGFTLGEDVSHYYLLDIAPLIQDTWKPNSQLTLVAGVRMDDPYVPQSPIASPVFAKAYGFSNSISMDGNYTISPRFGFNYNFDTALPTQVRGGAGLFLGQNPVVWVENSYNNAGQLNTESLNSAGQLSASTAVPSFDYTNPNFHWPANWKENIALDKTLPWLGIIATAEVDLSQVEKDVLYQQTNPYAVPTSGPLTLPDGRIRYAGAITPGTTSSIGTAYVLPNAPTGYYASVTSSVSTLYSNHATGAVYELTNTDKGGSQEYTLELSRPMTDGWAFSLAYTHTHATQVQPFSSSVASSGFLGAPYINPNDNIAYRSQYSVPDKFVATATREFNFFKQKYSKTRVSAQFITQTGQAYSFVFHGNADGDGDSDDDDLFYVPSGPNDPKVEWISATEEANFFSYLASNPQLSKWAGQIVPRNSAYAPWQEVINIHVEQEIPIWHNVRATIFADCYNFGNMLDKHSGIVDDFTNSFETQEIAGTGYDTKTNKYIYTFNPGTLGVPTIYSDLSRWQLQVGARLEF
jgi:carboxypeptidase family protein